MTDYYFRFDPNFEGVPYTPENTLGRKEMINFKCQQCNYTDEWWKFIPDIVPQAEDKTIPLNKLCQCPKCHSLEILEIEDAAIVTHE